MWYLVAPLGKWNSLKNWVVGSVAAPGFTWAGFVINALNQLSLNYCSKLCIGITGCFWMAAQWSLAHPNAFLSWGWFQDPQSISAGIENPDLCSSGDIAWKEAEIFILANICSFTFPYSLEKKISFINNREFWIALVWNYIFKKSRDKNVLLQNNDKIYNNARWVKYNQSVNFC